MMESRFISILALGSLDDLEAHAAYHAAFLPTVGVEIEHSAT
jgi:hypothetical protein